MARALGDRAGVKRSYQVGLALFTGASLLSAVAPSLVILIMARSGVLNSARQVGGTVGVAVLGTVIETGEEMKVGIIGAGNIGSALAGHFRKLQHTVLIANSRGPETLAQVAEKTGATPVTISEVAKRVDLLVITIPMKSVPLLPKEMLADLPATSPIVDTGNYYPLRDGVIPELKGGMTESEWTSHVLGRPVLL
jgi:lactate dehydrogenase-like 2-hydroxyacid dehydrogenase